jgi:hypothetical protein
MRFWTSRIGWSALAAALLLWACATGAVPAAAQHLGLGARPLSACSRISDASRLDALRRPGISAIRCRLGPNVQFAILSDDTVSWPVIILGTGQPVSLEDPLAKRAWFLTGASKTGAGPLPAHTEQGECRDRARLFRFRQPNRRSGHRKLVCLAAASAAALPARGGPS